MVDSLAQKWMPWLRRGRPLRGEWEIKTELIVIQANKLSCCNVTKEPYVKITRTKFVSIVLNSDDPRMCHTVRNKCPVPEEPHLQPHRLVRNNVFNNLTQLQKP